MKGLNSAEAAANLKSAGYNELAASRSKNVWHIALEVVREPMFLLLISCGLLYIFIGNYNEGIILMSTIFVIIFITFLQHRKTEKALESLNRLSSPRALVLRDGIEIRIPGREVVPKDYVIIHEGDRVPADGKLLEAVNLYIDESLITGESLPIIKTTASEQCTVLSGTLVTKGRGMLIVEHTGSNTQFGKIGDSLKSIKNEPSPLQKEMQRFIRRVGIIAVVLCVSVVALFYFTRGNFVQSLLNGLSSAMAILPEEFPVVLTVFLALGAWRLSKKNVLTRVPAAIETLGSATVLCSDKTGTITQNNMELTAVFVGDTHYAKAQFTSEQKVIQPIIRQAFLACDQDTIDPMERAILKANESLALADEGLTLEKEYAFSHTLMAMTRIYRSADKQLLGAAKGAPEAIFSLCQLDETGKEALLMKTKELAAMGLRVLAIAEARDIPEVLPEEQQGLRYQFSGLVGFEDPIREEVPAAIGECKKAGIRVVMITGDHLETALKIGTEIGLPTAHCLTGTELELLSDEALSATMKYTSILARIRPEQKLRIVQALKQDNEIVAMTGDGVNDAPALKAAHIGIAMGKKGTDVAREASSLVLLDDNFASIVAAIRLGRKIVDNLQKAMSYILAIHIPIIGLTLLPAFFPFFPLLLLPLQIVFMELIIDPVSSVAFESEEEELGIMDRPPRSATESFFGMRKILISLMRGALVLSVVLVVYFLTKNEGHNELEIRAITFSALIISNIFLVVTALSKTRTFVVVLLRKNWAAKIILLMALLFLALVLFIPSIARLFSLKSPDFHHFTIAFIASFIMLLILEIPKFFPSKK